MKDIKPGTASETSMFKAIQSAIGAYPNGIIGAQTMSDIAVALEADCFPVTLQLYGHPTIICKDIIPFAAASTLKSFANSISGSFSYNKAPCSILVLHRRVVSNAACHAFVNRPESVIYRDFAGEIKLQRCLYASDLPQGTKWAVGGMGLLENYDPEKEGFTGAYADVLRKTNHTVLGSKNGMLYLIYFSNMTAEQINAELKKKKIVEKAILLDGGHVAAMNGAEGFAQINCGQIEYYIIQAV
ncbi:MAG: hypothetical protein J5622_02120 [Firmicutes bacterium]|nr:hypothetical protein [Bacillota bacterium]